MGTRGGQHPAAQRPGVDAIFCGSDQIARGVADALREGGRRVPEDVALVGVDNWEPMVHGCRPPLTTVDMYLEHVGRFAAEHLLLAIDGEPTHGVHTVPCRLVSRGSMATEEQARQVSAMATGCCGHRRDFIRCRRSRNSALPRILGSCANL